MPITTKKDQNVKETDSGQSIKIYTYYAHNTSYVSYNQKLIKNKTMNFLSKK